MIWVPTIWETTKHWNESRYHLSGKVTGTWKEPPRASPGQQWCHWLTLTTQKQLGRCCRHECSSISSEFDKELLSLNIIQLLAIISKNLLGITTAISSGHTFKSYHNNYPLCTHPLTFDWPSNIIIIEVALEFWRHVFITVLSFCPRRKKRHSCHSIRF